MGGLTYEDAIQWMAYLVANECIRLAFLEKSPYVDEANKKRFQRLKGQMPEEKDLQASLVTLMRILHAHYGGQVILLIDEYDVPLDKAHAIWSCDCDGVQEHLRNVLPDTISYYDYHENYYHALSVGLLLNSIYRIRSNVKMDSENAIRQIRENNCAWPYQRRKYTVLAYGIAFADKDCGVKVEKL